MQTESQIDEDIATVRESVIFDAEWYLARYPDVTDTGMEPAEHYVRFGGLLQRNPSAVFDGRAYLRTNADVASLGLNPLIHYLRAGRGEGRAQPTLDEFDGKAAAQWLRYRTATSDNPGQPAPPGRRSIGGPGVRTLARGPEHLWNEAPTPDFGDVQLPASVKRLLVVGWDFDLSAGYGRSMLEFLDLLARRGGVDLTSVELAVSAPQGLIHNLLASHDFILIDGVAPFFLTPALTHAISRQCAGRHLIHVSEDSDDIAQLSARFPVEFSGFAGFAANAQFAYASSEQRHHLTTELGFMRGPIIGSGRVDLAPGGARRGETTSVRALLLGGDDCLAAGLAGGMIEMKGQPGPRSLILQHECDPSGNDVCATGSEFDAVLWFGGHPKPPAVLLDAMLSGKPVIAHPKLAPSLVGSDAGTQTNLVFAESETGAILRALAELFGEGGRAESVGGADRGCALTFARRLSLAIRIKEPASGKLLSADDVLDVRTLIFAANPGDWSLRQAIALVQDGGPANLDLVIPDNPVNRAWALEVGKGDDAFVGARFRFLPAHPTGGWALAARAVLKSFIQAGEPGDDGLMLLAVAGEEGEPLDGPFSNQIAFRRACKVLSEDPRMNAVLADCDRPRAVLASGGALMDALARSTPEMGEGGLAEMFSELSRSDHTLRLRPDGMLPLRLYRNRHSGEDVFVIAAGASAQFIPVAFFAEKNVIAVNRTFERFPARYAVFKEYAGQAVECAAEKNNVITFVARGECGNLGEGSRMENSVFFRGSECHVYDHAPNAGENIDLTPIYERGDRLVVSDSTVTTAVHLAAYMGARNILLVGHDCGTLDGQSTYDGYYGDSFPTFQGSETKYLEWLSKIEAQSLSVRQAIEHAYGCRIYSLNPFVNFALEGHVYVHASPALSDMIS